MKIDREVRNTVLAAPGESRLSFVLDWSLGSTLEAAADLASRKDRRDAIRRAVAAVKSPVLAALEAQPSVEVSDVEGSGHTVVAASADQWRALLDHPVIREAAGRILPNALFTEDRGGEP